VNRSSREAWGGEHRKELLVERESDTHKNISSGVLRNRDLLSGNGEKGEIPAGKMILRISLSRSFGERGREEEAGTGVDEERLRRCKGTFIVTIGAMRKTKTDHQHEEMIDVEAKRLDWDGNWTWDWRGSVGNT